MATSTTKNLIGQLIVVFLGIMAGYWLYMKYLMFWVVDLWLEPSRICYLIITYSLFALSCILCPLFMYMIIYKNIPKILKIYTTIIYTVFTILCWIGPNQMDYRFPTEEWNPFASMRKLWLYGEMGFVGLEVLSFIPFGLMLGNRIKYRTAMIGFAVLAILIEFLQSVVSTAPFRTLDCILYFTGLSLGYVIARLKIKAEPK